MRTLALRGGERVAVVAAEWYDAFGVVTRGRVQLELRDGEPGPVLGRGATASPGRSSDAAPGSGSAAPASAPCGTPGRVNTSPVRQLPNDGGTIMDSINDAGVVAAPAWRQTRHPHRLRGLAVTGFIATLAATVATTLAAALARAIGVDFEVPDGGETIPLSGFAVVTGFFSVVGIVIAVALLRWSARPAERFVWTAVSLTAISLVPPLLSGANTATTTALLGLHIVAATVMIPTLARSHRTRTD